MKPESALGRILIWRVTLTAFKENILFGSGSRFPLVYSNHQGSYFNAHKDGSIFKMVAGEPYYTFNDLLRIIGEGGIVQLVLFAAIAYLLQKYIFSIISFIENRRGEKHNRLLAFYRGLVSALVVIFFGGLFSYTFTTVQFSIFFWTTAGIIAKKHTQTVSLIPKKKRSNKFYFSLLFLPGFFVLVVSLLLVKANIDFQNIAKKAWEIDDQKVFEELNKLYPYLNSNSIYMIAFANSCISTGNSSKAIEVLNCAKALLPSKAIFFKLGKLYEEREEWGKAELEYQQICLKVPNLILPHYHLARLYYKTGQFEKFRSEAQIVLTMQVKVESPYTEFLRRDIGKLLKEQN